jgi:hypothetical protein
MPIRLALCFTLLTSMAALADSWLPQNAAVRHAVLIEGAPLSRLIPTQAQYSLQQMSREQLVFEKHRLEDEMPGLGGPIAITAVGGGGFLIGGLYLWMGLTTKSVLSASGASGVFITLGTIGLAVGVIGCAAGILWLLSRMNERQPIQDQLKEIDVRLNSIYGPGPGGPSDAPPPGPPQPNDDFTPPPPPPPPPMPPAASTGPTPAASILLARF